MMTMNKNLLIFFIFVIPLINFIFATPVLLSDQGTDLKLVSTGELLSTGNITIYIYDSVTGGSLIYSNLFINNITNGSWNVVINPNLEYGKNYWKDYSVNGDNLNFSGNDRIQFQSPLGLINNASLFNFSLINSCVAGSSIRQVYENGSVLCETDDTGSGGNSSWNESYANTKYLLQSEEGNLDVNSSVYSNSSTWWSGLSSWLSGWFINNAGVLEFNETKLNNTIDLRAGGDNTSWNESYANTQYADISVVDTQKNASGNYVYNDSTTIYFNETKLNNTIDLRDTNETTRFNNLVGNCSSGDFVFGVDSSGNKVCLTPSGSGDITSVQGDNFYIYNGSNSGAVVLAFNETKLNNTIDLRAGGDNSSWNESYADTQYSSITESLWSANFTAYNNSWSSTFNSTYDGYNSTGLINYWNDTYATFNKTYANTLYASISVTGDNSSWNESYADTQYSSITEPLWSSNFTSYNSSWSSTFNSTYDGYNSTGLIKNWNSTGYIKDWNLTGLIINWSTDLTNYFTKSQILSFNYWNDTYATFNKTYANTLYASISVTGDNSSWNESYADTQYSSITEPLWSSNFTSYNSSWSSTFNSTYDGYNSTGLIKNWNSTGYIKDWNLTGLIINWSTDLTNYFTKSQILSFNYWNDTYATF